MTSHLFGEARQEAPSVRAPRSAQELIDDAHHIIDRAICLHEPKRVFALFSGGHDSLCAAHVSSLHPSFQQCVHIQTGIGIPETTHFVYEVCGYFGWKLRSYNPPKTYREIVLQYGFPGPAQHQRMYIQLKERCLQQLTRECRAEDNDRRKTYHILLLTGARQQESRRRMGHAEFIARDGARIWCNHIMDWSDEEKHSYMQHFKLPRNPVVDHLCMSGECLCGSFAKPYELKEIRHHYPHVAAGIEALQAEAMSAGVHCRWGTRPPKQSKVSAKQTAVSSSQMRLPLCSTCIHRYQEEVRTDEEDEEEQGRQEAQEVHAQAP